MGMTTPVKFNVNNQLIAAGGTLDALTGWEYETPDVDCMVEVLEQSTATGLVSTLKSAGDTIKQEAGVSAGGTAGVEPARIAREPITGRAPKNKKVRLFVRNPTGGGITYDAVVILIPLARSGFSGVARKRPRFARRRR